MRYSSLASVFEIPWSASKITLTVSFRNNVRSNFLSPSPLKFSRAFGWIHKKWESSNKNPTGRENHSGSLVPWDRLWNPILWACYKEILNCKDNIRGHEMIHPYKQSRILPIPHLDQSCKIVSKIDCVVCEIANPLQNANCFVCEIAMPFRKPNCVICEIAKIAIFATFAIFENDKLRNLW